MKRAILTLTLLVALAGCGDRVCINVGGESGGSAGGCIGSGCDELAVSCKPPPDCEGGDCKS